MLKQAPGAMAAGIIRKHLDRLVDGKKKRWFNILAKRFTSKCFPFLSLTESISLLLGYNYIISVCNTICNVRLFCLPIISEAV